MSESIYSKSLDYKKSFKSSRDLQTFQHFCFKISSGFVLSGIKTVFKPAATALFAPLGLSSTAMQSSGFRPRLLHARI